jgi:hypothetical protein
MQPISSGSTTSRPTQKRKFRPVLAPGPSTVVTAISPKKPRTQEDEVVLLDTSEAVQKNNVGRLICQKYTPTHD